MVVLHSRFSVGQTARSKRLSSCLFILLMLSLPFAARADLLPPPADAPAKPKAPAAQPKAVVNPASKPAATPAKPMVKLAPPKPSEREFYLLATITANQDWKKNDPKYPGDQWSKASATQRIELRTRLHSEGKLELRNLLDPDLNTRLEAKTIYLARQAKKALDKPGQPFKMPRTEQEKADLTLRMRRDIGECAAEPACTTEKQLFWAAIFAAIDYPQAMEEDSDPGRYLYYMPYKGCPESSRITMTMAIDGVRFNKDVKKFIPFSERHSADSVNANDGEALCAHFTAVIDTQDAARPMYQETIFVPRPVGMTEYTENNHTAREQQPQPLITAVVDWMNVQLQHARPEGKLSAELPLPLPLNQNATWLGLWTGTAKVTMEWSFREVPIASSSAK